MNLKVILFNIRVLLVGVFFTISPLKSNAQIVTAMIFDVASPMMAGIEAQYKFRNAWNHKTRAGILFGKQVARDIAYHFRHSSIRFFLSPKFGVYVSTMSLTDVLMFECQELVNEHREFALQNPDMVTVPIEKAEYVLHREDYYLHSIWNETPNLIAATATAKYGESLVMIQMMQYRLDLIYLRVSDHFKDLLDFQVFADYSNDMSASSCGLAYNAVDTGWQDYDAQGSENVTEDNTAWWGFSSEASSPETEEPTADLVVPTPIVGEATVDIECDPCNGASESIYIGDCGDGYCLRCADNGGWLDVDTASPQRYVRCCAYNEDSGETECSDWYDPNP